MKILNLTGHVINVFKKNWTSISIAPVSGMRLQLVQWLEDVWEINGIPVIKQTYELNKEVLEFFAPVLEGVIYLVSSLVAQHIRRKDFYIVWATIKWPDKRTIVGCSGISKNPYV